MPANIFFRRLEAQNFKSIAEMVSIDYPEFQGMNFIYRKKPGCPRRQEPAAGKTTLACDALCFALFGRTLKNNVNKFIPNRNCDAAGLRPYCKLWFSVDRGRLFHREFV